MSRPIRPSLPNPPTRPHSRSSKPCRAQPPGAALAGSASPKCEADPARATNNAPYDLYAEAFTEICEPYGALPMAMIDRIVHSVPGGRLDEF